jgi:hypothetical protein
MRMPGHSWEKSELNEKFRSGNLKERGHLGDLGVDGKNYINVHLV